jgi:hypothetical protein
MSPIINHTQLHTTDPTDPTTATDDDTAASTITPTPPLRAPPAQPTHHHPAAFLLDSMLGRLCKWLRVLGVDAMFHPYEPPQPTRALSPIEAAQAGAEGLGRVKGTPGPPSVIVTARAMGRVVLTRDKKLAESRYNGMVGGCVGLRVLGVWV